MLNFPIIKNRAWISQFGQFHVREFPNLTGVWYLPNLGRKSPEMAKLVHHHHCHFVALFMSPTYVSRWHLAFGLWVGASVCPSHFSKRYSSDTAWRILFILGHNDPWVKAFTGCILFGHIFKVKVTVQGQSSLYKHIVKLQNPTPLTPLYGFCPY